jgi:hypothetical protein
MFKIPYYKVYYIPHPDGGAAVIIRSAITHHELLYDQSDKILLLLLLLLLWLYSPLLGLRHFFSFLILYTVGSTPWTGDQTVARPLPTHRTQTHNKRT